MRVYADEILLSPSDVTAYLACEHLTTLSLLSVRGEIVTPTVEDEQRDLVFRKGLEHERACLESRLCAEGTIVAGLTPTTATGAERLTLSAMQSGADAVYQAVFFHGGRHSRWVDRSWASRGTSVEFRIAGRSGLWRPSCVAAAS